MQQYNSGFTQIMGYTYSLVVLLLLDLIDLLHQLAHSQLQLGQLVFRSDLCIVIRMLANLDVQMNSLWRGHKVQYILYKHLK